MVYMIAKHAPRLQACSHEIFNLGLRNDHPKIKKTKFYLEGGFDDDLITDPNIVDPE
jgi:hypothetical protein